MNQEQPFRDVVRLLTNSGNNKVANFFITWPHTIDIVLEKKPKTTTYNCKFKDAFERCFFVKVQQKNNKILISSDGISLTKILGDALGVDPSPARGNSDVDKLKSFLGVSGFLHHGVSYKRGDLFVDLSDEGGTIRITLGGEEIQKSFPLTIPGFDQALGAIYFACQDLCNKLTADELFQLDLAHQKQAQAQEQRALKFSEAFDREFTGDDSEPEKLKYPSTPTPFMMLLNLHESLKQERMGHSSRYKYPFF